MDSQIKPSYLQLPFELTETEHEKIKMRLSEFSQLNQMGNEEWFSELCFCLLTANAQAQRAINIQMHLQPKGFLEKNQQDIADTIKSFGHRFHNNKAHYIVLARTYKNIKEHLLGLSSMQAREFLVKNIKGLGYKEASHFLRNVGYEDVAIIDRHILRFLYKNKLINTIPSSLTAKLYLSFEEILKAYGISLNYLDLMIWYHITGKILK